ncbi:MULTISPECIES: hypothetical protein [unclassified Methylophaga]|jgi:hypothetical protein|uniref:hypothetical protein n=1 Tax=unclassified Methylophaga TaxID=2629249 RepID=UPI000C97375F|nr:MULTISPECIES: hypothetical protein [unclassified Methylophaga]MAK65633.1 hypothetical protein [Methylophaga sp.]MAY16356.1 hypothetical protein [Methylophaga sp.]HAO23525.1 hypothetical protein [Methylophaga sp.]HCD06564.1 hypothetical protein [Methylophaga sp.]
MARLVKCKVCEYQVARKARTCVQCHARNPGLTATDYLIYCMFIVIIIAGIMLSYKITFNDQLIRIKDVEAAGFEKQYQRQTLIQNAEVGWVGEWYSERIEVYQFADTTAVDLEFFSKHAAPDNVFGWNDACIHKNIILLSEGRHACQILKQL